ADPDDACAREPELPADTRDRRRRRRPARGAGGEAARARGAAAGAPRRPGRDVHGAVLSPGMRVPYVDLARQHRSLKQELLAAVERVLDHGQFVLGDEVERFEAAFAALCGTRYAVALNSGTDALVLALRALGIGLGDEVITAPNSFVATAGAIALVGATPVFADVRDDCNIDPDAVAAAVTPRTRAILPVHLTGRPADMAPLLALASRHGLAVIEDAAQAVLAEYDGRRVGSLGAVGCFSLHPLKTLGGVGDAGGGPRDDAEPAARLRTERKIELARRHHCAVWSGNSRLDTVKA